MSMDHAVENNLPPHTDAPHRDPAAGTGRRPGGDWTRERDALREQVRQCEDHNSELLGVIEAVRAWCVANQKAARNRAAQTGDPDWSVRERVLSEVWNLVKPVV